MVRRFEVVGIRTRLERKGKNCLRKNAILSIRARKRFGSRSKRNLTTKGCLPLRSVSLQRKRYFSGTLHNWLPAVTNSVFKSRPPNVQFVVSSFSNGTNSSSSPFGDRI